VAWLRRGRYVFLCLAVALVTVGAGGPLAPPSLAAAQPQPTLVLSPDSGPCDAPVEVTGSGLGQLQVPEPGPGPALYLLQPGTTNVNVEILNGVAIYHDGTFSGSAPLWKHGCEAAAMDSQAEHPSGYLSFALSGGGPTVQPGARIPNILAVARYAYTTTTPQPQPAMTIAPSSGPCDATVQITGRDFPASTAIHLDVAGGGGESTLGKLVSLTTDHSGGFTESARLGALGCEAAQAVDRLGAGPTEFWIFASRDVPTIVPGQTGGLPLLTRAAYTYTTTASSPQTLPFTGRGPDGGAAPALWLVLAAGLAGIGLVLVGGLLYRSRRQRS
jgi:hypothetical protein